MKQPKAILHINPNTRKAYVKKPILNLGRLPGRISKPKTYRRKKDLIQTQTTHISTKVSYTDKFAKKPIQYVAMIMCHGSSCDSIHRCINPMFETKYDLILTSPHGTCTTTHGPPHEVYNHLCNAVNSRMNADTPLTGKSFMTALKSTINYDSYDLGQLHKNSNLKQRDQGSNAPDLNIFMSGLHSPDRIDGIYLFEVGHPCEPLHEHNVMTVNPTLLFEKHPDLWYVAQTASNLQSFIEPTEFHGVRHPHRILKRGVVVTKDWMDVQYKLKGNPDNVRLSDVVGTEGIFPPNTVVVGYVCRKIELLPPIQYDSPGASDYTTATSSAASSISPGDAAASAAVADVADVADDAAFDGWDSPTASHNDALSWDGSIGSDAGGSMKKRAKFKKTLKMRRS